MLAGQRRIEQAKLETYWRAGRLVHEHLNLHADDSGCGTQTIRRLARDLDLDESVLYRPLTAAESKAWKLGPGSIVRVDATGEFAPDDAATKADLFTYRCRDIRVVDGERRYRTTQNQWATPLFSCL